MKNSGLGLSSENKKSVILKISGTFCLFVFFMTILLAACSARNKPIEESQTTTAQTAAIVPPTAEISSNAPEEPRVYALEDLYALGFSNDDVIRIFHLKGNSGHIETVCAAADLQNFMRVATALTEGAVVQDVQKSALLNLYRKFEIYGIGTESIVAGEIGGKACYIRDGLVYVLDDGDYRFLLDYCSIVRPYPEDLDKREFLSLVQEAVETLPIKGYIPDNVNYLDGISSVRTVDDFYIKDFPTYFYSDIITPNGQYVIVVPQGNFYELQMGLNYIKEMWQIDEIKIARTNVGVTICPSNENLRLAVFGPSFTDISSWGMSQLKRVELYDFETGQVWWQRDGFCVIGTLWSNDGRYLAINHEAGRGSNRGAQIVLLDLAGINITAVNLLPPDGAPRSRLQTKEWISDTELAL